MKPTTVVNTNKCKGVMGFLFGHKLKPRYTAAEATTDPLTKAVITVKDIVASFRGNSSNSRDEYIVAEGFKVIKAAINTSKHDGTYVKDICVRCGYEKGLFFNTHPPVARQLDSEL